MSEREPERLETRLREGAMLGFACTALAVAFFVWRLDAAGLWSMAEFPVLDRARAANGAPLDDLVRSPWLPDWARALAYQRAPTDFALRFPGALASAGIVGLGAFLCHLRGAARAQTLWCAACLMVFPAVSVAARTVTGNPFVEFFGLLAVVGGLLSLELLDAEPEITQRARLWRRVGAGVSGVVSLGGLAGSIASGGLVIGAIIPVAALALVVGGRNKIAAAVLWVAVLIAAVAAYRMVQGQGEGFVPILGAAKDELLVASPHRRSIAGSARELSFALFPFAPLVLVGAFFRGTDRWPLAWALTGLVVASLWSMTYGRTTIPVAVPCAMAVAAGLQGLFDPRNSRVSRRMAYAVLFAGVLIMGKDASRVAHIVLSPYFGHEGGSAFPNEALEAGEALERVARVCLLLLTAAFLAAPNSSDAPERREGLLGAIAARLPGISPRVRAAVARALATICLVYAALAITHDLGVRAGTHLSSKAPFERFAAYAGGPAGDARFPETLGLHRLTDPGVARYGPPAAAVVPLTGRGELHEWIGDPLPRAAMIKRSSLPALHSAHRSGDWPMFVVDDRHEDLVLVSNVLPDGQADENPIRAVVLDHAPELAHRTLVRFDDSVEMIGWELEGPLRRGAEVELRVAFRVLRHMTASTQLYARFQRGKMSRVNALPHELAEGLYPPNNWAEGDYILHRFRFEIPTLEVFPGTHDFIVGMRRTESKNYPITEPAGETGEYGVRIRGKKHEFAVIGQLEIR